MKKNNRQGDPKKDKKRLSLKGWAWSSDRTAACLACLAAVLILADLLVVPGRTKHQGAGLQVGSASLILGADWTKAEELQSLQEALKGFQSLYPSVRVDFRSTDVRGGPGDAWYDFSDVILRSGPPGEGGKPFIETPTVWTGTLWLLAARQDVLQGLGSSLPAELAALRAGQSTPEQFIRILTTAKASGLSPITLGNSHRWPFILWLQHWAAAKAGPSTASALPAVPPGWQRGDPGAPDPWQRLRPAFEELVSWKNQGWFDQSVWNEGWARGLQPLSNGRALFALISAEQLTALEPSVRSRLEYLRFPTRSGDAVWTIGSASYLGLGPGLREAPGAKKDAARLLIRYLSSPGVTGRLSELTGKPFFAWDAATGRSPQVLAAWSDAALSPAYEALARELDPGK